MKLSLMLDDNPCFQVRPMAFGYTRELEKAEWQ